MEVSDIASKTTVPTGPTGPMILTDNETGSPNAKLEKLNAEDCCCLAIVP